jgi:hypothetical protein
MKVIMLEKNPLFLQHYKVKNLFNVITFMLQYMTPARFWPFGRFGLTTISTLFYYFVTTLIDHIGIQTLFLIIFSHFTVAWGLSIYSTLLNLPPLSSIVKTEDRTVATIYALYVH